MKDEKRWAAAWARFEAFRQHLGASISEDQVRQYHGILSELTFASGEVLEQFQIPEDRLKQKVTSWRPRSYSGRGGGSVSYSKDRYCDSDFFNSQIDAARAYLKAIMNIADPKDDKAKGSLSTLHIENMFGSNIQHGSPGAVANASYNAHFSQNDPNLLRTIQQVKEKLDTLELSPINKQELEADISTVEVQLSRPQPKSGVIIESLKSMRSILEGAMGSMIAPHLAHEIGKYLGISI